ncbi:disulfide bond formation protein B [Sphingomonas lenta]|uniref:Disulfide bond formation protein B n=1 Tax=Sphingomonas lenta TaxID=1141887 RepID=A0A2A2SGR6_9SPHN|nr:disulfide bond formation protein B [Sphingomonas lenta]
MAPARTGEAGRSLQLARALALLLPAALLAGAWGSQLIGGLHPCEMCHWQRWPHYAALAPAALAFAIQGRARVLLIGAAAMLIAVSGAIGVFHAGVEYGWWQGITGCTSTIDLSAGASAEDRLRAILNAPINRCDRAPWTLAGVSLAGFNAIFSLGGALTIFCLLTRRAR